jgi:acetyltransferase-like isoleucine patch superfamily enzyme
MLQKYIIKFFNRYLLRYIIALINEEIKKNEDSKIPDYQKIFKRLGAGYTLPLPNIIHNPQYIEIGENFKSLVNLRIEAWDKYLDQEFRPEILIGNNVCMNTDVHIGAINKIQIGNNVLIASKVYITDHSHGMTDSESLKTIPLHRKLVSKGPVFIEDNVWIGEGVCILPNVTIGRNAIIGANSVVTKNVPANAIAAGVPAQIIKIV